MQTKITQRTPVEYELEITATADDLAPEFAKALRAQQTRTVLKGFRPGKVPLGLVKKMYGRALAYGLADKSVQETYESAVLEAGEHDVLGQPKITELDYEMDGDLRAVVQFGVRPTFDLEDLSGTTISRLVHEVTDEEVEEEIAGFLQERADLVPVDDEPIGEADYVVFDLQELDPDTGTPIVGKRDEDQGFFLDDERLNSNPMLQALRDALLGATAGATVRFQFTHDAAHDDHAGDHAHRFMAVVKEVKRRDLPELDDALVQEVTKGRVETVDAFRTEIKKQLETNWKRRSRDLFESMLTERMVDLHPIPVPESVIELYLDSYVEDVKRRNDGTLPEHFDEENFRAANRDEALQQARWMLIRDKLMGEHRLDVTNDDLDAYFEEQAGDDDDLTGAQLRQFYQSMPRLMDQLEERLLSKKVYDLLASQFEVVEKDEEALEEELETRNNAS